jgi:hypothetical protein
VNLIILRIEYSRSFSVVPTCEGRIDNPLKHSILSWCDLFLDNTISVSNTTPEDIARAGINAGAIEIYKP